MDGLECSEILLSNIDRISYRFDSDFYSKFNLRIENTIHNLGGKTIRNINAIMDCSAFYPSITEYYNTEGIGVPFLRVNEISNGLVQITKNTVFLPQHILDNNCKTIATAYPNDIVIAKGGNTLAKVGLVTNAYEKYAVSRDVIVLHTSKLATINGYYLWAFLHSDYGQSILWRSASQTGQPHLTLPSIYDMKIPAFSEALQMQIKSLYSLSVRIKSSAVDAYSCAEQLLLSEFNIADFVPSSEAISIKMLSKSYLCTGRLDAEYYQQKYADYENMLKTTDTVSTLCNLYDKNFNPLEDMKYKYIELANVRDSGNIAEVETFIGRNLPSRARRRVKVGQIIVPSVEGSLQSCALITGEYDNALCSTGFYVLDSDYINSETLLVLFKSEPIQALMQQRCSGTILTAMLKNEFLRLPLPKINNTVQTRIASKVQESFALRDRSEQLLKNAKRAVEIGIECGEEKAIEWLKEKGVEA